MKTKDITPIAYSEWLNCSSQYVHKLLKGGRFDKLPHVIKVKRYSRFWVLEVPVNIGETDFKETRIK